MAEWIKHDGKGIPPALLVKGVRGVAGFDVSEFPSEPEGVLTPGWVHCWDWKWVRKYRFFGKKVRRTLVPGYAPIIAYSIINGGQVSADQSMSLLRDIADGKLDPVGPEGPARQPEKVRT